MINLTQNDLTYRLRTLNCCIASKSIDLLNKIKIGAYDVNCKLSDLQVLQGMLDSVSCYQVLGNGITEADNCLTEAEVQSIFDYMNSRCENCVQLPGFLYV